MAFNFPTNPISSTGGGKGGSPGSPQAGGAGGSGGGAGSKGTPTPVACAALGGAGNSGSDIRFKSEIANVDNALDIACKLQAKKFEHVGCKR